MTSVCGELVENIFSNIAQDLYCNLEAFSI